MLHRAVDRQICTRLRIQICRFGTRSIECFHLYQEVVSTELRE